MSRPLLQLALDHSSLEAAQRDVTQLKDSVDIVEAGTILCLNEGLGAVKALREQCPDKIIVTDWKVADAGETLAQQAFGAGANWMTIICAAPLATVEKGHAMAQRCGGEIQIELFGNWTLDDARDWHRIGVRQAIYHRGRDAQASGQQWGEADLARMKALSDIVLDVSDPVPHCVRDVVSRIRKELPETVIPVSGKKDPCQQDQDADCQQDQDT